VFQNWYNDKLNIACFNYGFLTLLLKCVRADMIQQYSPICLLNVLSKIFTKLIYKRPVGLRD
jgi:hypothetical protein